jgi:hypothetical protein
VTSTEVLARVDATWAEVRDAVECLGDGWAEAVIAGNPWEHDEEHTTELGTRPTGRSA